MLTKEERDLDGVAMNIVFQIGDALYEALPKDIAHDHFVDARQATNGMAIDFAAKLIKAYGDSLELEGRIDEVKKYYYTGIERPYIKKAFDYYRSRTAELTNLKENKQRSSDESTR